MWCGVVWYEKMKRSRDVMSIRATLGFTAAMNLGLGLNDSYTYFVLSTAHHYGIMTMGRLNSIV